MYPLTQSSVSMFSRAVMIVLGTALLLAQAEPDFDLQAFADAHPEFQQDLEGLNLRPAKHRRPAFLKQYHNVDHSNYMASESDLSSAVQSDLSLEDELEGRSVEVPMTLPGRHPSVEKALDGMAGDLEMLKQSKMDAKESRGALEGTVTDTMHHMNDAMAIKHAMRKKDSDIQKESTKLKALESDEGRLDQTHDSLVSSLHRMLGPKMMFAHERFEKKEKILRKEESAAKAWKIKKDQLHDSAVELIKQKKASYASLLESEAAVAAAKKKEEMARIQYEHDRTKTAEQVQSYRYAETRYKAEAQHEQVAKAAAIAAHDSMKKLYNVEHMEKEKVDNSISFRRDRLRNKIQKLKQEREKSNSELSDLEQKYKDWKERQRERTAEVIRKSQETAAASEAYATQQQHVLDSASRKVVKDAEAEDDWGGWGNDFTKVTDEDDE